MADSLLIAVHAFASRVDVCLVWWDTASLEGELVH